MRNLLLILSLGLSACSTVTTEIIPGDGPTIMIKSKPDALVQLKEKGRTITVDNRGRPGFIEQIISAIILRPTGTVSDNN